MKKIIITILVAVMIMSGMIYGRTKTTLSSLFPYIQNMKNVEYIGEVETEEDDFVYTNCFKMKEKSVFDINIKDKRRLSFNIYLNSETNSNIIYTFAIYIDGEPYYIKTEFEDKTYDLIINGKKNSNIKITFNALNKITNLIVPAELQILDLTI